MAWLNPWNLRKSIIINGTTVGPQTDYQMMFTIHKGVGTDGSPTSADIYLANVNDNFSDIRFTSQDGTTPLNYWIDSDTLISGTSVNIWVQIPSIPASPSTTNIYLYYYNITPGIITTSNPENTFIFFDDFNSGLGKWHLGSSTIGSGSIVAGIDGKNWLKLICSQCITLATFNTVNPRDNMAVEWKWYYPDAATDWKEMDIDFRAGAGRASDHHVKYIVAGYGQTQKFRFEDGLSGSLTSAPTSINTIYPVIYRRYNGTVTVTMAGVTVPATYSTSQSAQGYSLTIETNDASNQGNFFRDFRVRKYVSPEPTIGILGVEEPRPVGDFSSITVTSINMTPSQTPCVVGTCSITVDVTWTNNGTISGTYTPNIIIDGTAFGTPYPSETLGPGISISHSFIVTGLTAGRHTICPTMYTQVCPTVHIATQAGANITASAMTTTPSGSTALVVTKWTNDGGTSGIFNPTVVLDGGSPIPIRDASGNIIANVSVATGDSVQYSITLTGLTSGMHTVCPSPN